MQDKPPLYKQETAYSCVPACLRMVLASLGVSKTEEELRELCDCTVLDGTRAEAAVEAARKSGFVKTRKYNLDTRLLKEPFEKGLYPIVYVRTCLSTHNQYENHAVVVVGIDENRVQILDPARGEIDLSMEAFESEWEGTRRLTILIQ